MYSIFRMNNICNHPGLLVTNSELRSLKDSFKLQHATPPNPRNGTISISQQTKQNKWLPFSSYLIFWIINAARCCLVTWTLNMSYSTCFLAENFSYQPMPDEHFAQAPVSYYYSLIWHTYVMKLALRLVLLTQCLMLLRQIGDNSKYGDHRCVSMSHYCCKLPFLGEAFPGDRTSAHKTMLQIYPWKFCPYVLNIIRNGSTVIFSPLFTQWPIYLSPHKNAHTNHHRWGWGYYNNSSG